MSENTSYDILVTHADGTGPVRHTFTSPDARDKWLTENPVNYTEQNVNKLTGEIIEETVPEYVEAEKEGTEPVKDAEYVGAEKEGTEPVKDADNQRNQTADSLTDANGESPIFDRLTAETPNTGD